MVTRTRSQAPPPDLNSTFDPAVVEPRSREDTLIGASHRPLVVRRTVGMTGRAQPAGGSERNSLRALRSIPLLGGACHRSKE